MNIRIPLLATLLTPVFSPGLSAQEVRGRVLDSATNGAVPGAVVALVDSLSSDVATAIADSTGAFQVAGPAAGWYRLRSSRIGYAATTTDEFMLKPREIISVELRMDHDAIPLEPLTVTGRATRRQTRLELSGFHDRMRLGQGFFMEREQIEQTSARNMAEMLRRAPGVQLVASPRGPGYIVQIHRGGSCLPAVYLDGLYIGEGAEELHNHLANDADAVEVYTSPIRVPPMYRSRRGACGAVIIWTRDR